MSLKSDLKDPRSPVGAWARGAFPRAKDLYAQLRHELGEPAVLPAGWGNDQRWSWAGTAADTMLRWQLGDRSPCHIGRAGLSRVLADIEDHDIWHLTSQPPPLADAEAAARVAVLWALAEQHGRYGPTENPLTKAVDAIADDLLACAPDDVVQDVINLAALADRTVVTRILALGAIEAGPVFTYPGGADADLIAGSTLIEVKTTKKTPIDWVTVCQPLAYALLSEPHRINRLGWVSMRAGSLAVRDLDEVISVSADSNERELRRGLLAAAGLEAE